MSLRHSRAALVAAATVLSVLGLAACGDDDASAPAASSVPTSEAGSSTTVAAAGPDSLEHAEFCASLVRLQDASARIANVSSDDPQALEASWRAYLDAEAQTEALAPPEVKAAIATLVGGTDAISGLLAANGWDATVLSSPEARQVLTDPAMTSAQGEVNDFVASSCGA
ncbi:MAG: hypothetical protein IPM45_00650 [Acidimicrobiales bacterium]|nr:hypothetical protein [Acidimicrobiales bacterium]